MAHGPATAWARLASSPVVTTARQKDAGRGLRLTVLRYDSAMPDRAPALPVASGGTVRDRLDLVAEAACVAAGTFCLVVSIGILNSQMTIMFFDKGIDVTVPVLATYAAALLAPVIGRALGPRISVSVTAAILGVATATALVIRAEWVELIAAGVSVIAGSWWLALVIGSRSAGQVSLVPFGVQLGIAVAFLVRALTRTLPLDGAPLPASIAIIGVVLLAFGAASRIVVAVPRRWVGPGASGTVALVLLPPILVFADLTLLNSAAVAGSAGLAAGSVGAASTYIGEIAIGAGIACAFLVRSGHRARRLLAIAALGSGTALTLAHVGPVSLIGGALVAFGTLAAVGVLLDIPARDVASPIRVATALGAGWITAIALIAFYSLRFATDPIPLVVTAAVMIVVAIASTTHDPPRLSVAASGLLTVLLILTPAFSLVSARPAIVSAHPGPLRLMTYNVHLGYSDGDIVAIDDMASVIGAESPDLVALVEVPRGVPTMGGHDLVGQLAERLRMSFAFAPTIGDVYGLAILSRLPIEETRVVSLARRPGIRDQQRAVLLVRAGGLTFGATHLGGDDIDVQARSILGAVAQTGAVVIAGDMNSLPGSAQMRTLADGGLVDLGSGANAGTVPGHPELRIDYLWARGVSATSVHTIDTTASDHFPVVADVMVR